MQPLSQVNGEETKGLKPLLIEASHGLVPLPLWCWLGVG